jgi:2,3-dihydroxyphenylpropionate 1,2-dioxygenase
MSTALVCASHSPLLYCFAKPPDDWDGLQAAFRDKESETRDYGADLVIAFGADHFNGFFLKLMPAFCVGLKASAVGDIGGFAGALDVPGDTAADMVGYLRANDLDPAVSTDMTSDHAFSQTIHNMLGGLDARPTIPVFINAIAEPFVPFRRTRLLGAAIGRFAAATGKRVLFLASGGMSHNPRRYYPELGDGSPEITAWQLSGGEYAESLSHQQYLDLLEEMHHEGAGMIVRGERTAKDMKLNEEADRRFLDVFCDGRLEEFDGWDPHALVAEAGIGSMELHTWIAAGAAHKAAGGEDPVIDYYAVTPELGIACGLVSRLAA